MSNNTKVRSALSIGQLAKRWGISADRVRRLIDSGALPEAFKLPSAGRYGSAIRIPLAAIVKAESRWRMSERSSTGAPRRGGTRSPAALRHFEELNAEISEHGAECHGDEEC